MADPRKGHNNSSNRNRPAADDGEDVVAKLMMGLGAVGLGAGALYAASRVFSGGEEEKKPIQSQQRSMVSSTSNPHRSVVESSRSPSQFSSGPSFFDRVAETMNHVSTLAQYPNGTITIAVNATPTRAGGLLVFHKRKEVYFYSIQLPSSLRFSNESDKFEMINAYLALRIFEEYVEAYRSPGDMLILKADNTFCSEPEAVYDGQRNAGWKRFFQLVDSALKREPFEGEWEYGSKASDDYLRMADKLSRSDWSEYSTLPVMAMGDTRNQFLDYSQTNVSDGHRSLLIDIQERVPGSPSGPVGSQSGGGGGAAADGCASQ